VTPGTLVAGWTTRPPEPFRGGKRVGHLLDADEGKDERRWRNSSRRADF
jgi:hypothetical protein